jgi:hypothetical protein
VVCKSLLANAVQLPQASVAEADCWSLSCKRNALRIWIFGGAEWVCCIVYMQ